MTLIRFATLLVGGLLLAANNSSAEVADCQAQLKIQDDKCQTLAEKLAAACPSGTHIKEVPQCRDLSAEIAATCTRQPCAPPRKGKATKPKSGGMGSSGMGSSGMGTGGMASTTKGSSGMGTATKPAKKSATTPAE